MKKKLVCICNSTMELTTTQFDEFDCGMMGRLYCPDCKAILMPSHRREVLIREIDVTGYD